MELTLIKKKLPMHKTEFGIAALVGTRFLFSGLQLTWHILYIMIPRNMYIKYFLAFPSTGLLF